MPWVLGFKEQNVLQNKYLQQKQRLFVARVRHITALGFTLIELLVVIAIITLLLSILMPSLRKARERAKKITCLCNLRTIGMGYSLYAADYNGWLPKRYWATTTRPMDYGWQYTIAPYIGVEQNGLHRWGVPKGDTVKDWTSSAKVYWCPSGTKGTQRELEHRYYSYNTWGIGEQEKADNIPPWIIIIADHYHVDFWSSIYCDFNYNPELPCIDLRAGMIIQPAMKPVHGRGYNYLFADGHVQWQQGSEPSQWNNRW